jgi:hypothetical protein
MSLSLGFVTHWFSPHHHHHQPVPAQQLSQAVAYAFLFHAPWGEGPPLPCHIDTHEVATYIYSSTYAVLGARADFFVVLQL